MRVVIAKAIIVLALIGGTLGIASSSNATIEVHARVLWSFSNRNLEHGTKIVANIRSVNAPAGSKLIFQRTFGTTSLFENIRTIPAGESSAFSIVLPSVPVGLYEYRILIEKSGRLLFTSPQNVFHSYGLVSFSTICSERTGGDGNCGSGSIQLGNSSVFTYEASTWPNQTAAPGNNEYTFTNLSCRSGELEIAAGYALTTNSGLSATVQVAEAAVDPQLITVGDTSTSQFRFKLNRGAVYFDDWYSGGAANGGNNHAEQVWLSGSFDCYTLNGLIGK